MTQSDTRKSGNLLVVMADQLTAMAVGCYGNPVVKTPHMDRLAERGVVFDAAYAGSPLCTPARYTFMTGRHASRCGGYDNAAYLPVTTPTFAHYLRALGYRTVLCGKMHFVGPDQLHGFEERLTTDIYPADFGWTPDWEHADERIDLWYHNMSSVVQAGAAATTNQLNYDDEVGARAIRALYDHATGADPRPLCLVASFIHPHDPYAARRHYWDMYADADIPAPHTAAPPAAQWDAHSKRLAKVIALDAVDISAQDILRARRAYFANVSYIDHWLGRLLDTVDECDLDTTVLFTSDHGDMLGERGLWYKMSFFEWSNRIPLIIARHGRTRATRVAQPVTHMDFLPTLVDLACEHTGQPHPPAIDPWDGRSLLPLCDGADAEDVAAISEYLAEGTSEPMLMIRRGQYKFITCAGDPDLLYDLAADPHELTNLAAHAAHTATVDRFRRAAAAHWDADQVKREVIASQHRRRAVHAALSKGRRASWDYAPQRDASEEYVRSHRDLTDFDIRTRHPAPAPFKPRWR